MGMGFPDERMTPYIALAVVVLALALPTYVTGVSTERSRDRLERITISRFGTGDCVGQQLMTKAAERDKIGQELGAHCV